MPDSMPDPAPFEIAGEAVAPGTAADIEIRLARLYTSNWVHLPVRILHGHAPGPRLWLSAAIHGDELNGVEIIRQVIAAIDPAELRGTVLAIPVVNVFGFLQHSRYLPDRRDLNRSFPGSTRGSLASRLAHVFMTEIVKRCDYGVDLHTGSQQRSNWPQLRADLTDPETLTCAKAFGAPAVIDSRVRDGSLRAAASASGVTILLYEAGENSRFDADAIAVGVRGVRQLLAHLEMLPPPEGEPQQVLHQAARSHWMRARRSGILRLEASLGQRVRLRDRLGTISDPLGERPLAVTATVPGVVIGRSNNPLVNQGDAVVHIAHVEEPEEANGES